MLVYSAQFVGTSPAVDYNSCHLAMFCCVVVSLKCLSLSLFFVLDRIIFDHIKPSILIISFFLANVSYIGIISIRFLSVLCFHLFHKFIVLDEILALRYNRLVSVVISEP